MPESPKASNLLYVARYLERTGNLVCKAGFRMVYFMEDENKITLKYLCKNQ